MLPDLLCSGLNTELHLVFMFVYMHYVIWAQPRTSLQVTGMLSHHFLFTLTKLFLGLNLTRLPPQEHEVLMHLACRNKQRQHKFLAAGLIEMVSVGTFLLCSIFFIFLLKLCSLEWMFTVRWTEALNENQKGSNDVQRAVKFSVRRRWWPHTVSVKKGEIKKQVKLQTCKYWFFLKPQPVLVYN